MLELDHLLILDEDSFLFEGLNQYHRLSHIELLLVMRLVVIVKSYFLIIYLEGTAWIHFPLNFLHHITSLSPI